VCKDHQLVYSFIINSTLLTLCHSNMFQASKGHHQGVNGPLRAEIWQSDSVDKLVLIMNVCLSRFFM